MPHIFNSRWLSGAFMVSTMLLVALVPCKARSESQSITSAQASIQEIGKKLEVGDVVFIRIPALPFRMVASTTASWTNHVGIVIDVSGKDPMIAESRFPFAGKTTWSRFVGRSEAGRVAVTRLGISLDPHQREKLLRAVDSRQGTLYDTGFNLHSHRQFCSRYVREVLEDAAGVLLGNVEDFSTLLKHNPQADQTFWRMWYFGSIPWQRETVTPASLLRDPRLHAVFDGHAS